MFPAESMVKRNVVSGHDAHTPLAAMVLPKDVAWAIELRMTSWPRTSAIPYQDCRSPRLVKSASLITTG
jgi:hypothetical protein